MSLAHNWPHLYASAVQNTWHQAPKLGTNPFIYSGADATIAGLQQSALPDASSSSIENLPYLHQSASNLFNGNQFLASNSAPITIDQAQHSSSYSSLGAHFALIMDSLKDSFATHQASQASPIALRSDPMVGCYNSFDRLPIAHHHAAVATCQQRSKQLQRADTKPAYSTLLFNGSLAAARSHSAAANASQKCGFKQCVSVSTPSTDDEAAGPSPGDIVNNNSSQQRPSSTLSSSSYLSGSSPSQIIVSRDCNQ